MPAHAVNQVAETSRLVQVRVAHIVIPLGALRKSLRYLGVLLFLPMPSVKMSIQYNYYNFTIQNIHILEGISIFLEGTSGFGE